MQVMLYQSDLIYIGLMYLRVISIAHNCNVTIQNYFSSVIKILKSKENINCISKEFQQCLPVECASRYTQNSLGIDFKIWREKACSYALAPFFCIEDNKVGAEAKTRLKNLAWCRTPLLR